MKTKTENKSIRSRSRKCKLFNMSLIKRNKIAQVDFEPEAHQPHPSMDGLYYAGKTRTGAQSWKTADELAAVTEYKARQFKASRDDKSIAVAENRHEVSRGYDREADDLLNRHRSLGMSKAVFARLARPVKRRLKAVMPNIVWSSEADRQGRMEAALDALEAQRKFSHDSWQLEMEAKMASSKEKARLTFEALSKVEGVYAEARENSAESRKPLTQHDLNEMSNSRYEVPACYSEFAKMTDDDGELY